MTRLRRLTCVLLLSSMGCRGDSHAPTVVEFCALGREGEVVQGLVPEFERRTPDVRIRVQQIPWSAAHEKLLTAYVGDVMPDVFQLGNTWLPELVALNALEPLNGPISGSTSVTVADYFPGVLDTNVMDAVTYGLPWYVDTRLLFYRTDTLAQAGHPQAPTTWDDWLDAMTRIKQRAGEDHYAILLPFTEWQPLVVLALELDASLLRDQDQYGNFRSAPFRRAFEFYLDLFRRGLAPRTGAAQVANLYQDFANGYFSLYISGPWNIGEFQERLPPSMADKWATAPMPGPDAQHPGVSVAGGASLAIFRGSPRKAAAWKWIEYLSEPAQQIEFYRRTGDLPSRRAAWSDPALAENRYAQAFWQQLQRVQSTPKIPEWERIADKISQYAEAAIRGGMSADAALNALDSDVDALLEKRRWMLRSRNLPPFEKATIRHLTTALFCVIFHPMMTLRELMATFPTEDACKQFLADRRWVAGTHCPRCNNEHVYKSTVRPWSWECKACPDTKRATYRFSVTAGTIFENTKYPLKTWFEVLWSMLNAKKGISAMQIQRQIGCSSYSTAFYMCHRLRAGMRDAEFRHLMGIVEVDETYIGGKNKNRHKDKRTPGRGTVGKTPVVGAIARKGNVVAMMIEATDTATLEGFVRSTVSENVELVATDDHSGYDHLNEHGFNHEAVAHSQGEYVRGIVHTGTIDGFWSLLKRGIMGSYHSVSKKYLPLYINEFSFRYNNRENEDMFGEAIAGC